MDALAELDAAIAAASPAERAGLVVQLAARLATLGAGLVSVRPAEQERNLSVAAAAERLGVSSRYVFRHAAELGGIHVGRRVLIPERSLARVVAGRGR